MDSYCIYPTIPGVGEWDDHNVGVVLSFHVDGDSSTPYDLADLRDTEISFVGGLAMHIGNPYYSGAKV